MIGRLLTAALLSGVSAGVAVSVVQEFTTAPIILHAEEYERLGASGHAALVWADDATGGRFHLAHDGETHDGGGDAWAPADGLERTVFTVMANIIAGVAYGALLIAAFHLRGAAVDGRTGLMWGVAGFVAFAVAPSLGLPPETPGAMAAELGARQLWWAFAAASTAAGLWLLLLAERRALNVLGVALIVLPHAVGAPHPGDIGGAAPPELAGRFVAASIATGLVFWSVLGWLGGRSYERFVLRPEAAGA